MLKVAILDDYQKVSEQFINIEKLSGKYEIKSLVNHLLMKLMLLNNYLILRPY